ncbi:SsgA family sporulation/cell division regulator [Streptomyces sp. NPDC014894]|uniref:SsgA family sporulation/cell division regulator n=1 Tax=unclassified Streptomyces TaxID=2593676 RepID=UPI0036F68FCB
MLSTVEQSIPAHLVNAVPPVDPMTVRLVYSADDPLAVRMTFPAAASLHGTSVTWVFARDLLASGLLAPAGRGDVLIRPCGRARTTVELRSPYGVALLRFATGRLRRFLLHAYAAVPAELESRALDVDAALAALLPGARDWQE